MHRLLAPLLSVAHSAIAASLFLIFTSGLSQAAVTGTYETQVAISHYGASFSNQIKLAGTNFTLNATINCTGSVQVAEGSSSSSVNIDPSTSITGFPGICAGPNGYNNIQLIYNGQTYQNVNLTLSFSGRAAIVPNSFSDTVEAGYFYTGTVAGIAFTMSGKADVYSSASNSGPTGTLLFSVPLAGSGTLSGTGGGATRTSGIPYEVSQDLTYLFSASPTAFSTDATTQGNWSQTYGGEGYLIANGPSYLPSYAAVSIVPGSTYTWAAQTSEARALQLGPAASDRIASTFTGNNLGVNINFTDGNPHRVAFYLLDYDNTGRSETITITDAATGTVLDTETVSNFQNGVYAIFNLEGNVSVQMKTSSGVGAVLSGILFGPSGALPADPGPATASAVYFSTDSVTQGNWPSKYSGSSYFIAGLPSNNSNALKVSGASTYVWSAKTSDPRALLNPNTQTGLASTFTDYAGAAFTINVYNSQMMHLSLYLLDWDNEGRSEILTVTDLSSGTVLSTQTVSRFQNGVYITWLTVGNISIKVQPIGSTSAAVSGVFLY